MKFDLKKINEKNLRTIFTLTIIIVCISLNFLISGHYFHITLSPDESTYNGIAIALLNKTTIAEVGQFKIDIGQEVTPFYSMIVAFAYSVFPSHISLIGLQVLLNCIILILLFNVLTLITENIWLSFIMILGFTFYFPLWAYNFFVMMEIPTVFLLSVFIYLCALYYWEKKYVFLYTAVIAFSLLVLMNNRFIVLLLVFLLYLGYLSLINHELKIKHFLYSLLIAVLVISPWFIRQYQTYGQFVFFTPMWHNVVARNIGLIKEIPNITIEEHYQNPAPTSYDEYMKYLKNTGTQPPKELTPEKFEQMVENNEGKNINTARFKRYFTLYDKDYKFLYPGGLRLIPPSSKPYKIIQLSILLPLLILTLIGTIFAFRNRHVFFLILVMLFAAHVSLHVLVHYIDRYRLTILPVMLILSTYGFSELMRLITLHRKVNL